MAGELPTTLFPSPVAKQACVRSRTSTLHPCILNMQLQHLHARVKQGLLVEQFRACEDTLASEVQHDETQRGHTTPGTCCLSQSHTCRCSCVLQCSRPCMLNTDGTPVRSYRPFNLACKAQHRCNACSNTRRSSYEFELPAARNSNC